MRFLSLSLVAVALVATIGLSWLFDTVYQSYQHSLDEHPNDTVLALEQVTVNLASVMSTSPNRETIVQQWQGVYRLQLMNLDQLALPAELLSVLKAGRPLTLQSDNQILIHARIPASNQLLLLVFAPPGEPAETNNHRYWLTSLFYFLLISILIIWLTPLLARLFKLRAAAKAFGEGDLGQRIQVGSISYIKDVESEFNHMAQRIEDLVSDVKLLSTAVSHDLRTPLAKLRMGLDTLREEDNPDTRELYHQRLDTQLDAMVELVETLLQYARMDQTMLNLEKRNIDLLPLLSACINQQQEGIVFTPHGHTACMIKGDARYLKIAMNNLLQNAVKYGNGKVQVALIEQSDRYEITVEDNGEGVPELQRSCIFKPFVRGQHKDKKGFGVGLAIVKRVMDWHQGRIDIGHSKSLGGAKFEVHLQKA
ncbi:HAMP domain-containing sensor histidine kinase [Alteromonas sp. A079]|uniref:HAMP domain-containing sensor histidine kinase n=1 Tax=Alteromonas sp. A079 TaxID=3410268 RepID=UPI003B9F87E5